MTTSKVIWQGELVDFDESLVSIRILREGAEIETEEFSDDGQWVSLDDDGLRMLAYEALILSLLIPKELGCLQNLTPKMSALGVKKRIEE